VPIRRIPALIALLLALVLAACGGESADVDENLAAPDVLANASERMANTQSMRFDLRVEGETFIDPAKTIQLVSARGSMARPDRVDVEFQARLFGAGTVTIKMITVGNASWTTNLLTGKWETAPEEFGYNPAVLYDNQNGLGPVMGKLWNVEVVGIETVDDRTTYHISGDASQAVMDPLTANTMEGDRIGVELWIDGETWDLLRIVLKEPESAEHADPATWTMHLTDHDKQVSIEPPV
jgi:outer membrane lipoprotein-sorting protein